MNRVMPLLALILVTAFAPASSSNHYTLGLLQTLSSSEVVAKIVTKQLEEDFQLMGIKVVEENRIPGCEQFEILFKKFNATPAEDSVRTITIATEFQFKKGKVKVGVKRKRTTEE